jgi:hypothetical protein
MKQLSWVVAAAAALAMATPVRAQAPADLTPPPAYSGPSTQGATQADRGAPAQQSRSAAPGGDAGGSMKRRMPQGGHAISN